MFSFFDHPAFGWGLVALNGLMAVTTGSILNAVVGIGLAALMMMTA